MLCSVAEGAMDGREISIAEHRYKDTPLTTRAGSIQSWECSRSCTEETAGKGSGLSAHRASYLSPAFVTERRSRHRYARWRDAIYQPGSRTFAIPFGLDYGRYDLGYVLRLAALRRAFRMARPSAPYRNSFT